MTEREQAPFEGAAVEAAEPESLDVRRLPHLISGARASSGSDKVALALEINKVLIAMRAPGQSEEESKVIVSALDAKAFDGLIDDSGRSCRKEAVESLLACGFPHALNIGHEDLVYARNYQPVALGGDEDWKVPLRRARRNGAAVIIGGELLCLLIMVATTGIHRGGATIALLSGFVAAVVSVLFALSDPKVEGQAGWGTALGLCALVQLISATSVGPPALLGGVGIIFGLLVALSSQYEPRADPPKPDDWDYKR